MTPRDTPADPPDENPIETDYDEAAVRETMSVSLNNRDIPTDPNGNPLVIRREMTSWYDDIEAIADAYRINASDENAFAIILNRHHAAKTDPRVLLDEVADLLPVGLYPTGLTCREFGRGSSQPQYTPVIEFAWEPKALLPPDGTVRVAAQTPSDPRATTPVYVWTCDGCGYVSANYVDWLVHVGPPLPFAGPTNCPGVEADNDEADK